MKALVEYLCERITSSIRESLAGSATGELRRVFHGPCLAVLEPLFERLAAGGGLSAQLASGAPITLPVLLQVDRDRVGGPNPALNASGRCNPDHLTTLRNSPASLSFFVLLPPGSHSTHSISSASEDFGVGPAANSGNATIEEWLGDDFVRSAIGAVADRLRLAEAARKEFFALFEAAARHADDLEHNAVERTGSWSLLSRLFDIPAGAADVATWISLACGVPPRSEGGLRADQQLGVLRQLSSRFLERGFRPTFSELMESCEEDRQRALNGCLAGIEGRCSLPTQFEHAPTCHYRPGGAWELAEPPAWWRALTVEAWAELLQDEEESEQGELSLSCANSVAANLRGLDGLVLDEVKLVLGVQDEPQEPTQALVIRKAPAKASQPTWEVPVTPGTTTEDRDIPSHRSPLRYEVEAPGYEKAAAKIVSLSSWEPGFVIDARTARRVSLPKKVRGKASGTWETSLLLEGTGRHYIDVYVQPEAEVTAVAEFRNAEGEREPGRDARITRDKPYKLGFDLEATADCTYTLSVTKRTGEVALVRVALSCEEASPEGCSSEFERLIRLNRQARDARVSAEILVERSRTTVYQEWALDPECSASSYRPVIVGRDLGAAWRKPDWSLREGAVLSAGRILCDPRPSLEDMTAPQPFLECRARIAARVLGEDGSGLLETAKLGEWTSTDPEFRDLVASYVSAYSAWLAQDPVSASWVDLLAVCDLEHDGLTLEREPDAVIVSPMHPLRLAWHAASQRAMWEAHRAGEPSPAASILDPRCVPDVVFLPVQTNGGSIERIPYFSVDTSSDYWSVLWHSRRLPKIAAWAGKAPFDRDFGFQVGGVASGFSIAQVGKALDDILEMRAAKPIINVLVASSAGQTNSCNDGLMEWGRSRLAAADPSVRDRHGASAMTGRRTVQVLDLRDLRARPDDAKVANIAEDTNGALRWMDGKRANGPTGPRPDLGIIAQLESAGDNVEPSEMSSPLSAGALFRHRVRRQVATMQGAFLHESRSGVAGPPPEDPLLACLGEATERLERQGDPRVAHSFAPSVHAVQGVLERADFATVSSSSIDPACFLGGWLGDAYLWDYDLPSYSRRAGDSNGYYLLSRVKDEDAEALVRAIGALPGGKDLPRSCTESILREVARRGIPTVRGLSAGDHGASGDLGLFIAARLLQDEFREGGAAGILRLTQIVNEREVISLIIPVDPFQGYLEDLQGALGLKGTRPDLLVATFDMGGGPVRCKLTPVEVKFRSESKSMTQDDRKDALGQARALSELLEKAREKAAGGQLLWRLTFEHLLVTMIGFGLRVYSQKQLGAEAGREWARHHERIIAAVLSGELDLEIDGRGRLLVVDGSAVSSPSSIDGDQFDETITICLADAATVVKESAPEVSAAIRSRVGHWDLLPSLASARDLVPPDPVKPQEPEPAPPAPVTPPHVENPTLPPEPQVPGATPPVSPSPAQPAPAPLTAPQGITIHVGTAQGAFRTVERAFSLSDTQLNQLNMGVVGDLGTGKTQFLKSLILQVSRAAEANRGIRPRMLILDYKKDYTAPEFVEAVGAKVIRPSRLPLNIFDTQGLAEQPKPWLQRLRFFTDTLAKIYSGIGPVQVQYLKEAVKSAYEAKAGHGAPTLADVRDAYREQLKGKYDSPYSIIDYLVEAEIFDPAPAQGSNFGTFLDGIVVLALGDLGQDDQTKNMLVAVMLNMFYEHMLTIPKRPYAGVDPQLRVVDSFLLVDEADNILKFEFDVLRKLLLQGREFGVGVILASQYLRHFKTPGTDYREPLLSWFIHKVPNVTAQELSALGMVDDLPALVDEVKRLQVHHCLFKTVGVPGEVVRATPFFEMVGKP